MKACMKDVAWKLVQTCDKKYMRLLGHMERKSSL